MSKRCCQSVVKRGIGSWPQSRQCGRLSVVTRDGKPYCQQHDPPAVEARRKAMAAKWDAKWKAQKAERAHEAACIAACKGLHPAAIPALVKAVATYLDADPQVRFAAYQDLMAAFAALTTPDTSDEKGGGQ